MSIPADTSSPAPERGSGAPTPRVPLWLVAAFIFSGTLGMHIFVPALPDAGRELGISPAVMQMTVSLYILGLAVGQLIYGPLSDRIGRRIPLMAGLALFVVAGLAAAVAPGAQMLIAARLLQAMGGCAGFVLGRAIVRDTSSTEEAAKRLSTINLIVTIGPALAPLAGSALAAQFGWRAIFLALVLLGVVNILLVWRLLPETAPPGTAARRGSFLRDWLRLLRMPAFIGYAIGGACATTTFYAFVAAAPYIVTTQLHRPAHDAGLILALLVSGVWLGSFLARRLIARMRSDRLLVRANLVSVVAAALLFALTVTHNLSVTGVVVTMFAYTLGIGVGAPASLAQAMSVDRSLVGSASGLYGFLQMAFGALSTTLAGIGGDPALAAASVLIGAGVLGQLCFWLGPRLQKQPARRQSGRQ